MRVSVETSEARDARDARFDGVRIVLLLVLAMWVAEVADRHGKPCGVAAGSVEMAEEWMSKGYRAIAYGSDFRLFADGLTSGIDAVRKLVRPA